MENESTGKFAKLVAILAIGFSLFHLYTGLLGTLDTLLQRLVHLSFALLLIFIIQPYQTGKPLLDRLINSTPVLLVIASTGYIFLITIIWSQNAMHWLHL